MRKKLQKIKSEKLHHLKTNWLLLSLTTSLLGIFLILSSEIKESIAGHAESIFKFDHNVLQFLMTQRTPKLNEFAVNITALGSETLLTILVVLFSYYLLANKKIKSAMYVITSSIGSSLLTSLLKDFFERQRPDKVFRLVDVDGFSYPSGHSLASSAIYMTIALLLIRELNFNLPRRTIAIFFALLILCIATSRIYLGVHFLSDITAGLLLGVAWCSFVTFLYYPLQKNNL